MEMGEKYFQRGVLLYRQQRYPEAIAEFRQLLAQDPEEALGRAFLSLSLLAMGNWDQATQEAQRAIGANPELGLAHYALGAAFLERNRFDEALDAGMEAIRLDPSDADFSALVARIYMAKEAWGQAVEWARRGLEKEPQHELCLNLEAMGLVSMGKKRMAKDTIGTALAHNPENALTHANLGWTLLNEGAHQKAMEHFREALRLDPNLDWARQGMVEALKAKNPLYRLLLRYFLWSARIGERARWIFILGLWFLYRVLARVAGEYPSLKVVVTPLLICYIVWVLSSWLGPAFFNLLLCLNRLGRLALSRAEIQEAILFGLFLGISLTFLSLYAFTANSICFTAGAVFGFLLIPLSGIFRCQTGWPRRWAVILTLLLALTGLASLGLELLGHVMAFNLFIAFCLGTGLSTWIFNLLGSRVPKK